MKLRKVISIAYILLSCNGYSQEFSKNSFGIVVGGGGGYANEKLLLGWTYLDVRRSLTIGVNYYGSMNKHLIFETGIHWYNAILFKKAKRSIYYIGLDERNINQLYMPLFLRVNILKHFFVNGGALFNVDLRRDPYNKTQIGFGGGGGIGAETKISERLILFANPYFNVLCATYFIKDYFPDRIVDYGIKVGIRTIGKRKSIATPKNNTTM